MNKEQMNKYAYELMVKNNPDEAVKNLLLKDKEIERSNNIIEELEKWLNVQLKDTNKCLDYAREYHNLQDTEKYTRDHNMYAMILDYLDKLKKLKEGK